MEEIAAAEPPTGFQGVFFIISHSIFIIMVFFLIIIYFYAGLMSWLFPPAIALGVYFNVPVT